MSIEASFTHFRRLAIARSVKYSIVYAVY